MRKSSGIIYIQIRACSFPSCSTSAFLCVVVFVFVVVAPPFVGAPRRHCCERASRVTSPRRGFPSRLRLAIKHKASRSRSRCRRRRRRTFPRCSSISAAISLHTRPARFLPISGAPRPPPDKQRSLPSWSHLPFISSKSQLISGASLTREILSAAERYSDGRRYG